MKKLLISIAVFLPIVVVLWLGVSRFRPACGEVTVSEQMSPDGRYMAAWMIRKCGTESYVDHINLRLTSDTFSPSLLDGTIKADEVFTLDAKSGRVARFAWSGPRRLLVQYQGAESRSHRENLWRDVAIEYSNH